MIETDIFIVFSLVLATVGNFVLKTDYFHSAVLSGALDVAVIVRCLFTLKKKMYPYLAYLSAFFGSLLNSVCRIANGGYMPVTENHKLIATYRFWVLAKPSHKLLFLSDRFFLDLKFYPAYYSIGDVIIFYTLLAVVFVFVVKTVKVLSVWYQRRRSADLFF